MTTTTATTTKAGKAKDRKAHVEPCGVLVLTIDGAEFVADGPETYHVCIDDGRGRADSCECKGHLRWGKCKHAAALRALLVTGRLPAYLARPIGPAAPTTDAA